MNSIPNDPKQKSGEHLIARTALTESFAKGRPRDFFACKECNSAKSSMDFNWSMLALLQSDDEKVSLEAVRRVMANPSSQHGRFVEMIPTAKRHGRDVHMTIPLAGDEIIGYGRSLAKGQYFKRTGQIFQPNDSVIGVEVKSKPFLRSFQEAYSRKFGHSPYKDLAKNDQSDTYGDDEVVVYCDGDRYMFVFHGSMMIMTEIRERSKKSQKWARGKESKLRRDFSYVPSRLVA